LTATEEKSLRASAAAQKILGAAMYIHPGKHPDALAQIVKILESTGVDMRRVILCHVERTLQDVRQLADLLRSGCTAEYDLFGMDTTCSYYWPLDIVMLSDAQRLEQLRRLIDAGFLGQLLISHDICFKHRLHKYGGHGYDHILVNTLPWMRQRGFTAAEIDAITQSPAVARALELSERPGRSLPI
jgi:phosphotriesterase-related protein